MHIITDGELYWNAQEGKWVEKMAQATTYTDDERSRLNLPLGPGIRWVPWGQMTDADKRGWLDFGGDDCPACGSQRVKRWGIRKDGEEENVALENNRCEECGASWTGIYMIADITEMGRCP